MKTTNRIFIVQHCQSEHHINDLTGGWTDTPLTELGSVQAEEVARALEILGLEEDFILYSSDLKRASMTAEKIETLFDKKMVLKKSLREFDNGVAAGKTKLWANENILFKSNTVEIDKQLWDGSETFRDLYNRVSTFIKNNLEKTDKDIVIVSHGVAISYMITSYLKLECETVKQGFMRGSAGGISVLSKSPMGQNTLTMFNSTAHLSRRK